MRFTPTQKMRIAPTVERLAIAAADMMGWIRRASRVSDPSNIKTGMAEKMQPLPMDVVMMQTSSASMAPLRMRVEGSALMPSWMDPTIAMAPMLTVSDAVTKASTNENLPRCPSYI